MRRESKTQMKFRIIENVSKQDVEEIHSQLKKYNSLKREASESIPLGIFYEESDGEKRLA